jgi:hypothetical protein
MPRFFFHVLDGDRRDSRGASLWGLQFGRRRFGGTTPRRLRSSSSGRTGDGSDEHGRRVSSQGARLRRARCSDARLLRQGTIARNSEEVADHGRFRRKARALGRLTWRPRYSAPFRLASPTLAIAANSPRTPPSPPPAWPRGYLCEGSPACWESATPKTIADARDRLELHRCGRYSTRRRTRCSPRGPCRSQS